MIIFFQLVLISACAGIVYGCSFVLQQRGILSTSALQPSRLQQIGFFLARILILGVTGQYLLRSPMIPSILGSITFFSMFWLVLLAVRTQTYERT